VEREVLRLAGQRINESDPFRGRSIFSSSKKLLDYGVRMISYRNLYLICTAYDLQVCEFTFFNPVWLEPNYKEIILFSDVA